MNDIILLALFIGLAIAVCAVTDYVAYLCGRFEYKPKRNINRYV